MNKGHNPELSGSGRLFGLIETALEISGVLLILTATMVSVLQVFCRYVLNASLPWPEELAQFSFVWAVFLGMALLTGRGRHIAISLFVRKLSARAQRFHAIAAKAVIAAASLVMVIHGLDFMSRSMQVFPALGLPLKYLYLAAPTGAGISLFLLLKPSQSMGFLTSLAAVAGGALGYLAIRQAAPFLFGHGKARRC